MTDNTKQGPMSHFEKFAKNASRHEFSERQLDEGWQYRYLPVSIPDILAQGKQESFTLIQLDIVLKDEEWNPHYQTASPDKVVRVAVTLAVYGPKGYSGRRFMTAELTQVEALELLQYWEIGEGHVEEF